MSEELIHFFTEGISYKIRERRAIRRVIKRIIEEKKAQPGPINIIYCSDETLKRYNRKYLNRNYFTDVIAFNLSGKEGIVEGDIYISLERIKDNASIFKERLQDEINRVIIHGILHLIGLDDNTEKNKGLMRKEEDKFMSMMVSNYK